MLQYIYTTCAISPSAFQAVHFAFPTKSNADDGLLLTHGPSVD